MYKTLSLVCMSLILAGCQITQDTEPMARPELALVSSPEKLQSLDDWLKLALVYNPTLNQAKEREVQASLALANSNAAQLPDLKLALDHSRRKTNAALANGNNLTLSFSWELDWLGKLDDSEQQAVMAYEQAKQASFQSEQTALKQVSVAFLTMIQTQTLLDLYEKRAALLGQQLQMLEENYQLGLTSALDVYLARNNVASEQSRVVSQKQALVQAFSQLQIAVGVKSTQGELTPAMPTFNAANYDSLGSEMALNRPDVQAAWYELLASNKASAASFKAQFPNFKLTASGGYSADEFKSLLKGDFLWSWVVNLSQPLFDGGRLANDYARSQSNERIAKSKLQDTLNKAYGEIEVELANYHAIGERVGLAEVALENARMAQDLSFSQYQKGLVNFTTVLDAQKRALDAEVTKITLSTEQRQQIINLETALGRPLSALFSLNLES